MKRLIFAIAKVFSEVFVLLKGIIYPIFSTKKLGISKSHSFYFENIGIMPKWLFQVEHLKGTNQGFEKKTLDFFYNHLKPGDTVLDIGANIGVYSLLSSSIVGKSGKVYSFEPVKETNLGLAKNIELNKCENVIINKIALSDRKGKVQIGTNDSHEGKTDQDLYNHLIFDDSEKKHEMVDMVTLDEYCQNNNILKIDFIKIDVEGAELLVFKGAKACLKKYKPIIILESDTKYTSRFGYTTFDVLIYLYEIGYTFECYEHSQWLCIANK